MNGIRQSAMLIIVSVGIANPNPDRKGVNQVEYECAREVIWDSITMFIRKRHVALLERNCYEREYTIGTEQGSSRDAVDHRHWRHVAHRPDRRVSSGAYIQSLPEADPWQVKMDIAPISKSSAIRRR